MGVVKVTSLLKTLAIAIKYCKSISKLVLYIDSDASGKKAELLGTGAAHLSFVLCKHIIIDVFNTHCKKL